MKKASALPRIFDYEDYRAYLKDYYRARKAQDPAFSFGVFARRAGISSRAYVKLVMDGRRNLSADFIQRFSRGLKLTMDEAEYFQYLVLWCQERDEVSRLGMHRLRENSGVHSLQMGERAAFLRHWANWLVLGLSRVRGFRAEPVWISRRLEGRISPSEARDALKFLRAKGYLRIRGHRLIRTLAGRFKIHEADGPTPKGMKPFVDRLYQELGNPAQIMSGLRYVIMGSAVLSEKQAGTLNEKLNKVLMENTSLRTFDQEGELFLCSVCLVPLSKS